MSNAFLYRMPSGIPGAITRHESATVEPQLMDTTDYPTAYGVPTTIDSTSKKLRKIKSGDTAASVTGFLVRPYPANSSTDGLGTSTPPTSGLVDQLKRGYLNVLCKQGTAAKGGKVYLRLVADTGKAVGDLEASAVTTVTRAAKDGGNTGTGTCTLASPAYASDVQEGVYEVRCTAVTDGSAAASAVANAANTGNATIGTVTPTSAARFGLYTVVFTAATAFDVYYPDGTLVGTGATGSAFSGGGLGFTITAGATPMVASDSFTIAVTDIGVSVWSVTDPNGVPLADAKSGTAYTAQIKFTIAEAATKFVVGDGFDVTVSFDTVELPGAFWTGPADADTNCEIAYNL